MSLMAVSLILLAVICSVMSGVRVKAPLGGNASVHCSYNSESDSYPKHFSRGWREHRVELIRLRGSETLSATGRFSLEDDREKREFTVTIKNVSVDDAGLYWCGTDQKWRLVKFTEVNLDVVQDTGEKLQKASESFSPENATSPLVQTTPCPPNTGWKGPTTTPWPPKEKAGCVGGLLAACVLGCGIASVMFVKIHKNNAKKARAKQSGNNAETIRVREQGFLDACVYDEVCPMNTTTVPVTPPCAPSSAPTPGTPAEDHCTDGQTQCPETVVYFCTPPESLNHDIPPTSSQSLSVLYSTIDFGRRSLIANDGSPLAESQVVYIT